MMPHEELSDSFFAPAQVFPQKMWMTFAGAKKIMSTSAVKVLTGENIQGFGGG